MNGIRRPSTIDWLGCCGPVASSSRTWRSSRRRSKRIALERRSWRTTSSWARRGPPAPSCSPSTRDWPGSRGLHCSSRDYSSGGNAGGRAATGAVFPISRSRSRSRSRTRARFFGLGPTQWATEGRAAPQRRGNRRRRECGRFSRRAAAIAAAWRCEPKVTARDGWRPDETRCDGAEPSTPHTDLKQALAEGCPSGHRRARCRVRRGGAYT